MASALRREEQRPAGNIERAIHTYVRSCIACDWQPAKAKFCKCCPPDWLWQWMADNGYGKDGEQDKGGEQGKGGFGEKDNKRKADFDEDKKDDDKGKVSEQVQSSSSSSSSRQIPPWRRDQPHEDPAEPLVETPATKEARIAHLEFLKPFVERLLYWHKHGGLEPHYPPEWSQQSVADAHVVCTHLLRKLGIADRHL